MARRFRASHSIRNFYIIVILFRVATVMSKRLNLQHFIRLLDAFNGIELEKPGNDKQHDKSRGKADVF